MKLRSSLLTVAILALGCGPGLMSGIDSVTCDPLLQTAIDAKCSGTNAVQLTCAAMTKATAKKFEKADIDTCAANIKAAADCTGAKAVTCRISYTE